MLYDFHIHTREYSDCSISSAEEMCQRAVDSGLAGIALTEHDFWRPSSEIRGLQERFPELTIMRGMEHSCSEGHFLVFLPNPENGDIPGWCSILDLIPLVHNYGGIVIWAHPFRFSPKRPNWLNYVQPDGMEVASSNMDRQAEAKARKFAADRGIVTFQNSDAHDAFIVGKYVNELDIHLTCVEELIDHVRKQKPVPVSKAAYSTPGFAGF
ncbi:MAG: PHP-associated domain-containing protein [Syntrophobacterales bacterium]|jgi:predicted metal-dependent phosphoesterase TrpH